MWGISWLAANQLASQEGLCTMEWVSVCDNKINNVSMLKRTTFVFAYPLSLLVTKLPNTTDRQVTWFTLMHIFHFLHRFLMNYYSIATCHFWVLFLQFICEAFQFNCLILPLLLDNLLSRIFRIISHISLHIVKSLSLQLTLLLFFVPVKCCHSLHPSIVF